MRSNQLSYPAIIAVKRVQRYNKVFNYQNFFPKNALFSIFFCTFAVSNDYIDHLKRT